ncbi:energy transducer TonB [uncultured Algimonas sp.]|uniref:energy transducer TonB n=1 Tax=uncultured Algimonas sp. TaxID=1547920 RepID=UPI002617A6D0|nr:energy transducer TonB [uncultured Algimonas sp.]
MRRAAIMALGLSAIGLAGCGSTSVFNPQSQYPPDPYVKGYADPDDCIGGEALAAIDLDLPEYPKRPFRTGRQGWVLLRLDIAPDGSVAAAETERALPVGLFEASAERAVRTWTFEPPRGGALTDCRVLVRYRMGAVSLGG